MTHVDRMQLVCPACGCHGSIETFATHTDAGVCNAIYGAMSPDVAAVMQRYVRLFAPPKHDMTWRRARRVLEQLAPLVAAQRITAKGREWPAPHSAWISAINGMLESRTLQLPLRSNGYLMSVLMGDADKTEAQAERAIEQQRRGGRPAGTDTATTNADTARAQTRTATALLVTHATTMRMKFDADVSDSEARQLLKNFSAEVVDAALIRWKRGAK